MPFVVQEYLTTSSSPECTLTVQNIIDATSQDLRKLLASTGADATILIDYLNRIHLELLRHSRWAFLLSPVKRFITEAEQTDYWIGATGSAPAGVVDTELNLTDIGKLLPNSVFDRSNFRVLKRTNEPPLTSNLAYKDASSRPSKPALYRNAPDTRSILNIYPAPDNQNSYQPEPPTPIVVDTSGGALPARTYFVRVSLVDTLGNESTASIPAARQVTAASYLAVVKAPQPAFGWGAAGVSYDRYNVYASTTEGSEQLQNASPIAITADWTEPVGGLIAGVSPPSTNGLEPLRGYIIEFRYWKIRQQLTSTAQVLQIPDDYKDVVVAGVNWLGFQYLKDKPEDTATWLSVYQDGKRQLIRDKNLFPKDNEFVRPDPAGIGINRATIDPDYFALT